MDVARRTSRMPDLRSDAYRARLQVERLCQLEHIKKVCIPQYYDISQTRQKALIFTSSQILIEMR